MDVQNNGSQLSSSQAQTYAKISADGRYVVFDALNVNGELPGNNTNNVYVRDLQNNTTELISQSTAGVAANSASYNSYSNSPYDISADGRYVVFSSDATNLVPNDTNGYRDVFLRDRKLQTTTILSNTDTSTPSNGSSDYVTISCDGAYVAFFSTATNLVTGDPNAHYSIYVVDRASGNTIKDIMPNANANAGHQIALSCDGSTLLFGSQASNLVANDTNNIADIFAYHLESETVERINVSSGGQQDITYEPGPYVGISFNGRYVTFATNGSALVSGDTNNTRDIFIRDLQDRATERVNMRSDGTQTISMSDNPFITEDGREVLYVSNDSGLVSGDTNRMEDVFTSQTGY
ncbi:MAG TPA: hypothetical protein VHD60_01235 [Candidatus Saccharimonadales bacterium]|nr:hypothetical protein [Candidatus Saccharimonadales bacterium]